MAAESHRRGVKPSGLVVRPQAVINPAQQFCSVSIVSLKTMDQVHNIRCKEPINEIRASKRVLVVTFQDKICVYNACTFKERFCITGCFPVSGPNVNPIALHTRWLAFADKALFPVHQTRGGVAGEGTQSYTATVIHAAKTLGKGLSLFSETVASSLTGHKAPSTTTSSKKECHRMGGATSGGLGGVVGASTSLCPGVVSVVDVLGVSTGSFSTEEDSDTEGLVAHFQAHHGEPLSALHFDPSGVLLFTADRLGHNFHLFHLMPHPGGPTFGSVQHLYTLHRGDTTAKIQDVAFSLDSRWVAVSTLRGTTHIFPITPYGGPITRRTHTSPRVVNRLSRFHKSAGLEEIQSAPSTGRNSPVLSGSPSSSTMQVSQEEAGHWDVSRPNVHKPLVNGRFNIFKHSSGHTSGAMSTWPFVRLGPDVCLVLQNFLRGGNVGLFFTALNPIDDFEFRGEQQILPLCASHDDSAVIQLTEHQQATLQTTLNRQQQAHKH
ncbi:hypothetical protein HPB51_004020 [Rhipicephalus microplus]|uniref:BCAS3 WD40 domain-containing protein n=1 Tax=Rhipicephalus microplus TaxID=6941 RepID=A0A9J6EXG5_RHIMP|nr:hypothetical protein HPB51_004020 [Rhipicephalus microplus]